MEKNIKYPKIPKITKPTCENDIRPISLTPCLSKVLDDFVVLSLIEDVRDKIDPMQFGCLKGTSTSYCLLDMVHNWLLPMENPKSLSKGSKRDIHGAVFDGLMSFTNQ